MVTKVTIFFVLLSCDTRDNIDFSIYGHHHYQAMKEGR
jgi:hypothetical protein